LIEKYKKDRMYEKRVEKRYPIKNQNIKTPCLALIRAYKKVPNHTKT